MPLRIRPYLIHGYLFSGSGGERSSLIWHALRARFRSADRDAWRHVFALGRFDFAVLRLARKLYGSDLALFDGGFIPGVDDVVEFAWYQWDEPAESLAQDELKQCQETEWKGIWDLGLPVFALIYMAPCPQWGAGARSPRELSRAARLVLEELKEPIAERRLAVLNLGGFGPEPMGMLVFAETFQVLFAALAKVEQIAVPGVAPPRPAFQRVRTVCGVAGNTRLGGEHPALLDELSRDLGVLQPRTSVNTAPGVSPTPEVAKLAQVGGASFRAAIGPVDYEVIFKDNVPASKLLRALYEVREEMRGRLDRLETVAAVEWTSHGMEPIGGWHESADSADERQELELEVAEAMGVLKQGFVDSQARDVSSVVEAVTFMLERGYVFLANRATAHLVEDLRPFLRSLCAQARRIRSRLTLLQSWSDFLNDTERGVSESAPNEGDAAERQGLIADARKNELEAREDFARMCRNIRLGAPLFARALRQRASGSFPHLLDANMQARADTHFGSFRLFIAAAQGVMASLYRAAGPRMPEFTGFVTCGTEHDVMNHPGRIVNVPFHLLRRPETFHLLAHEFGHHVSAHLDVPEALRRTAVELEDAVPELAHAFPPDPQVAPSASPQRVERIRETAADIVWCVAASEEADALGLREFPHLVAHLTMYYDQLLACSQVSRLAARAICLHMAARFRDLLGDRPDGARARDLLESHLSAQCYEEGRDAFVAALNGTYRRMAEESLKQIELPGLPHVSHMIQEGVLFSYLLSPTHAFGAALADIAAYGPAGTAVNDATELCLLGQVPDAVPRELPGARLSWCFDKASAPEEQVAVRVTSFNARLAMVLTLTQLR